MLTPVISPSQPPSNSPCDHPPGLAPPCTLKVAAGLGPDGAPAAASGVLSATPNDTTTASGPAVAAAMLEGLLRGTRYDLYLVAEDVAGNWQRDVSNIR